MSKSMHPTDFGYVVKNNVCLFQKGPLSQWYGAYKGQESSFKPKTKGYCVSQGTKDVCQVLYIPDTVPFNCCEQWMMWCKARLFNDFNTQNTIIDTLDPKKQKELGRQVKNFDEHLWNEWKDRIVTAGNEFKFAQNQAICDFLYSFSEHTIFAEAAPWDKVWGIGLGPEDPDALDITKWKGENLLGEAIRKVRRLWK